MKPVNKSDFFYRLCLMSYLAWHGGTKPTNRRCRRSVLTVHTAPGVGGGADAERRGSTSAWMGCPDVKVREVKRASS